MKAASIVLLVAAVPVGSLPPGAKFITPELAEKGWILLFDGESPTGWNGKGGVRIADERIILPADGKGEITWQFPPPPAFELAFEAKGTVALRLESSGTGVENIYQSPDAWTTHAFQHDSRNGGLKSFGFRGVGMAEIRGIRLRPLGAKSLFNGQDLSGWSIFEGKKSRFDVKNGLLTVEDGPGDLQTDGRYKDFLLQLECRTNGKHLNSGVFFRCRPGEYQNGYEAQINNNFLTNETKEYAVEIHDPVTHQLLEKRKILSPAADFGTGAIYRRIPTGRQVAKDGQWFTFTVLASGNHLATWVDGIPTVDWFDNRPPSDNARTGFRKDAGHISLQGHDPTTNLSFRNFRIVELP